MHEVGMKISHVTLLERIKVDQRPYWKCQCECGKIINRREDLINNERITSCGCQHPSLKIIGKNHYGWKGYGDIPGQYFDALKNNAIGRNLCFEITIEQIWNLFLQQNERCALTDIKLKFSTQRQQRKGKEQTASLDRIDSTKGYVQGNLQWIHKDINRMKLHYGQERFIEVGNLIAKKHPRNITEVIYEPFTFII